MSKHAAVMSEGQVYSEAYQADTLHHDTNKMWTLTEFECHATKDCEGHLVQRMAPGEFVPAKRSANVVLAYCTRGHVVRYISREYHNRIAFHTYL